MASSFQLLTGMEPPMGRVAAVVWWFVPLANLIMPPLFVAGLMRDLAIPGRRRHRWLVPLWWLTYMGSIGAVLVWSFQLVDGVQRSGALETLRELDSGLLVISQVMAAVAAVALIAIVLLVNRNVAIRYQAALQGWPPPPP
jgi:hypothetical protein